MFFVISIAIIIMWFIFLWTYYFRGLSEYKFAVSKSLTRLNMEEMSRIACSWNQSKTASQKWRQNVTYSNNVSGSFWQFMSSYCFKNVRFVPLLKMSLLLPTRRDILLFLILIPYISLISYLGYIYKCSISCRSNWYFYLEKNLGNTESRTVLDIDLNNFVNNLYT